MSGLDIFLALLIGAVTAFLAGMFGVGGAGLTTPALRLFLGVSPGIALGTTLPVVIPTAASGAYTYYCSNLVEFRIFAYCGSAGVAGSIGGALLTKWVNLDYLMIMTGVVVLYLAGTMLYKGITGRFDAEEIATEPLGDRPGECAIEEEDPEAESRRRGGVPLYLAIGLAAGFFSGLLGIGGGIVLVPSFVYLLRMPIKKAFGTSLAVIIILAIPGTVVHALLGHISGWLFLLLAAASIPCAYLGARLSIAARERFLYVGFGVLIAAFGVVFIVDEIISLAK